MRANLAAWREQLLRWPRQRWKWIVLGTTWYVLDNRYDPATRINQFLDDNAIPVVTTAGRWLVTNILSGVGIIGLTVAIIVYQAFRDSRRGLIPPASIRDGTPYRRRSAEPSSSDADHTVITVTD